MKTRNVRRRQAHRHLRRLMAHGVDVKVPWSVIYRLQGMSARGYRY